MFFRSNYPIELEETQLITAVFQKKKGRKHI